MNIDGPDLAGFLRLQWVPENWNSHVTSTLVSYCSLAHGFATQRNFYFTEARFIGVGPKSLAYSKRLFVSSVDASAYEPVVLHIESKENPDFATAVSQLKDAEPRILESENALKTRDRALSVGSSGGRRAVRVEKARTQRDLRSRQTDLKLESAGTAIRPTIRGLNAQST